MTIQHILIAIMTILFGSHALAMPPMPPSSGEDAFGLMSQAQEEQMYIKLGAVAHAKSIEKISPEEYLQSQVKTVLSKCDLALDKWCIGIHQACSSRTFDNKKIEDFCVQLDTECSHPNSYHLCNLAEKIHD